MDRQDERLGMAEGGAEAPRRGRRTKAEEAAIRAAQLSDDMLDERDGADDMVEEDEGVGAENFEDDALLDVFLDSLNQTVLPRLPEIPGYHVCWLTTSNPRDSVDWRLRVGYTLLRYKDFPGMTEIGGLKGDTNPDDKIQINEMIAAKIPARLYNKLMLAVHHQLPLNEEVKLRSRVEEMGQAAESQGGRLVVGDGTRDIVQRGTKSRPEFDV